MADEDLSSNTNIPRGLINRTGNPIGRGSRLPSVRGHRDLTLGGVQRKVFVPNLAAVKKSISKDESSNTSSSTSPSSLDIDRQDNNKGKGRGKSDRGRGRGRGRGHAEDRTIQLHSEFSYGPMGEKGSLSGWARRERGNCGEGGGGGRQTDADSVAVKAALRHSKGSEEDKKLLDTLMNDKFIADLACGDPCMAPVRLPLDVNQTGLGKTVKTAIKAEVVVHNEADRCEDIKPDNFGAALSGRRARETQTVQDILNSAIKLEKGELIFFQFPDTLPGLPASAKDEQPKVSNTSTPGSKIDELAKSLDTCQLKDCHEGYLGKLRIRKSGKTELVLGDNIMEVMPGIPVDFYQELVSIRTDQSPGQMVVLGQVDQKLVVTPDYSHLLAHVDTFS